MSDLSIDIESQNSQSQLQTNLEPSSGVEMATPASQESTSRVARSSYNVSHTQKSPCNTRFWLLFIFTIVLAGGLSVCSWQLNRLEAQADEIQSHYIQTTERILTVNTTQCAKLFGIGFLTHNQPPTAVTTSTLTFDCPINQCSCDSYADQWILKQRMQVVYYVDSDPTNFETSYPTPLNGPITGYVVGTILVSILLLSSIILTIRNAECKRC